MDYKWECQKTSSDKGTYYIRGGSEIEIQKDYKVANASERITRISILTQITAFMEKHGITKIEVNALDA